MSFSKRRIVNFATEWANEDVQKYREGEVQTLESLRKEVGLSSGDINQYLDQPDNWYSNHVRGGRGSHEFMLSDFESVRVLLSWIKSRPSDPQVEDIDGIARKETQKKIDEVERIRQIIDISPKKINSALDLGDNWYQTRIQGDEETSLSGYLRTLLFVESIMTIYMNEGYVEKQEAEDAGLTELAA